MTSNLGGETLAAQSAEVDSEEVRDDVMRAVQAAFRPEFINRLDEIIIFHRLLREHMNGIVDIQLNSLTTLLDDKGIKIQLDGRARLRLADQGYDPAYGARPLKRVILSELQNPLANLYLQGKVEDGDVIKVSAGKDGLIFNGQSVAEATG